jgi:transglutaminase-like putative cysteine protease
MESRQQRLSLDELQLLRWLVGGVLMLLSVATVFYLDIGSEAMAALVGAAVLAVLVRPALAARVPPWVHRLAFPAIVVVFAADLWHSGQLLPAIVRLDLLLILYRGVTYRARRDDLQVIVLGLFLIVVAGVLTVSLLFAAQILVYTAFSLGLLLAVTIAESGQGGLAPKLAVKNVVPTWASIPWRALFLRVREVADWRLLASASALFLGVVAVSALLFLAIPRFQLENSLFLERFIVKRAMTGFNDQIKFGDITDITEDDSIAFNVDLSDPAQAPANPYWRMVVLDEYSNGGFKLSPTLRSESFDRERTSANILAGTGDGPTWTFYLESGVSRYLPLLGGFGVMRFREAQNYRVSRDLGIVALRDEPASMTAYRVEGMQPDSREIRDPHFASRWKRRGAITANLSTGLSLAASDRDALARLVARALPKPEPDAVAFAEHAMAWLRSVHRYSLAPRYPEGPGDPLVRWMSSSEPGHCELFAGALVLMCRSAGVPARVVTGFKGGTWNAFSGNYTIRNSDAHAWVEVFDARRGSWVREDPLAVTASGDAAKERGDAALAGLMDRSWTARLTSLRVFWYRRIVNFDQQAQVDTLKAVTSATETSGKALRESISSLIRRVRSWFSGPWDAGRILKVLAGASAAAGLAWGGYSLLWRLLPRGRGRPLDPVRREAGRWLMRVDGPEGLVADLQRLRYGPAPTWPTPSEVFRSARRAAASSRRRRRISRRNTS